MKQCTVLKASKTRALISPWFDQAPVTVGLNTSNSEGDLGGLADVFRLHDRPAHCERDLGCDEPSKSGQTCLVGTHHDRTQAITGHIASHNGLAKRMVFILPANRAASDLEAR